MPNKIPRMFRMLYLIGLDSNNVSMRNWLKYWKNGLIILACNDMRWTAAEFIGRYKI